MSVILVAQLEGVLDGSEQKASKMITKTGGEFVIEEPSVCAVSCQGPSHSRLSSDKSHP
jgi:hypothetical protein